MTAVVRHDEFETKFTADDDVRLPDLVGVGPVATVRRGALQHLVADYYDTDDLRLIRRRITLRRRSGGTDDGWHVKLPVGTDDRRRQELHLPLHTPGLPPVRFVELLLGQTRGAPLGHVVTVHNRRAPLHLLDAEGAFLAEVTDDHVRIDRDGGGERFREIEVELASGVDPGELAGVIDTLVGAGAVVSDVGSKAARALGPRALEPYDVGPLPDPRAGTSAHFRARLDLLPGVLSLLDADLALRLGDDDGTLLHRALERLLAAVREHRTTIGPDRVRPLVAECTGLSDLLADRSDDGRHDLRRAIHRGRYLTLLDRLVDLARDPGAGGGDESPTVRGTDQGGTT